MSDRRLARYRLLQRIGAGGMAEVFRAELEGAEGVTRALVVKRIHGALAQDPDAVAMFVAEARIAARLNHPNVVQVYELGRDVDDYFLAMELVEGCDLASLMRSFNASPAPMGLTAWVVSELLEALSYVHELRDEKGEPMGLVHRDVSPHNVLVGVAGEVKLADFGIAKAALRVDGPVEKVKGKLAFMAPEQARGEPLDARADLFGAGAILYEMLCGARPYREGDALVERVRAGDIVPIRERAPWLSDELVEVVSRAVAPEPACRFADARTFREALSAAFAEDAVRPDRSMLASAVRARQASAGAESSARSERTVTAEEVVAVPEPVASASSASPAGKPRSRWRVVAERAVIAAAVFVVAVLAERRTRPPPAPPPIPPDAPVSLGAPPLVARAIAAHRGEIERACATTLDLSARGVRRSDLSLLRWRDFASSAEPGTDLAPHLDPRTLEAARAAASRLGVAPRDGTAALRFLPMGMDPTVFFARRSALSALGGAAETSAALRDGTRDVLGALPRVVRAPGAELDGWSVWDLAFASIALRRSGFAAHKVWVAAGATDLAAEVWAARAVTHDPEAATDLGASQGVALTLGWDRVMQALDLLVVGADLVDDQTLPPALNEVAFGWAPLSRVAHAEAAVWRFSRPPRGDDWRLDARGEPLRLGAHLLPTELYVWTASAEGIQRGVVRCVLGRLLQPPTDLAIRERAGLSGWTHPPRAALAALDPALRESIEGVRYALLRDPGGDPRRRPERWWSLWRDAVLGSVRGSVNEERALHDTLRARGAAQFGARR